MCELGPTTASRVAERPSGLKVADLCTSGKSSKARAEARWPGWLGVLNPSAGRVPMVAISSKTPEQWQHQDDTYRGGA